MQSLYRPSVLHVEEKFFEGEKRMTLYKEFERSPESLGSP